MKPFQIIVQVSLSETAIWDARTPTIPALLDTGNNHNFSIQENQLRSWTGLHPRSLPIPRRLARGRRTPSLRFANVWIHRNRSGTGDIKGVSLSCCLSKKGSPSTRMTGRVTHASHF